MLKEFNNQSYSLHRDHFENTFDQDKLDTWKKNNTTDYWRHKRMYSNLDPFIQSMPDARWLTIGDGRYGNDAHYILAKGATNVLATDISDTYLKIALDENYIQKFQTENAEKLSLKNSSVDYVLCKESYHHFPRPMIALYEMLRVATRSVILIEPRDQNILIPARFNLRASIKWMFQSVKNLVKRMIGKELYYNHGNYESVGNYVFTVSEREIEKVALGMNFEMVSFKGINDLWVDGVEYEDKHDDAPLYNKIRKEINSMDKKCKKGVEQYGYLIAVIHKTKPDQKTLDDLGSLGFEHRALSRNPYA